MEYTINKLAKLSGISTRTLRYYDQIGLLSPSRISSNDYRIYGESDVNLLQQILFYKELGLTLAEIKKIISDPEFSSESALINHLSALEKRQQQLKLLIRNVTRTINSLKGDVIMTDNEKFEGFKKELLENNEREYGKEAREKYGDNIVEASYAKIRNMTPQQNAEIEALSEKINETLKAAMKTKDPAGELALAACEYHKRWLCYFWADGMYSREAHAGLGEMYVQDPRFKAYYDKIADGAAEFLMEALKNYCKD